jgi:mitotic spindle assembly checkpoint protein MAD2B
MAAPPKPIPLNDFTSILHTFSNFFTLAIHNILYVRGLYPEDSFIKAKAYNYPVRQNRHPKVCEWINDAVKAVEDQIAGGKVEKVSVVIHDEQNRVRERWVFDLSAWPVVDRRDRFVEFEDREDLKGNGKEKESEPTEPPTAKEMKAEKREKLKVKMVDIEQQLRATIRMLNYTGEKMTPLPEDCTFTVMVELRDEAEPPIDHPHKQPWEASVPDLQTTRDKEAGDAKRGNALGGDRSRPVRTIDSGAFVLETWVEEAEIND